MDTRSLLEQLGETDDGADDEPWVVKADRDLRGAAHSLHEAAEALTIQRQSTNLRRFETLNSAGTDILDSGLAAAKELASTATAAAAQQRVLELETELPRPWQPPGRCTAQSPSIWPCSPARSSCATARN